MLVQEAVQQSADTQLRHRDAEIAQLRAELAAMAQTKSRDVVPQSLVSLLKTAAAAGAGADGEAAAAAAREKLALEERARRAEAATVELTQQADELRRRVALQDRLLQVNDAVTEESVTLRREKAFLLAQLEEAQGNIDLAEGRVDARAGAALARETGTLRVNPSNPFVVSADS